MDGVQVGKATSPATSPTGKKEQASFAKTLRRRFSQPTMETKPDPNRRRSLQDLLAAEAEASASSSDCVAETTPERSTPLSSSALSRAKLNLGSLVPLTTRNLGGTSPTDCPHSAPVFQTQSAGVGAKVSSHRRKLSVASIGGSFRLASPSFDTNGSNSSPNTAGRSPLSAGGRVVGRLSSLLKREWSAHSLDEDADQGEDATRELEALILNSYYRHALVSDLLANRMRNASLAVRFINGVHIWKETADPKDRKVKGRKLLAVFFDPTSQYFINDLPKELLSSLQHDNLDALEPVKRHLLRSLESNEFVATFMKQVQEETSAQLRVNNNKYLAEISATEAMELA